MSHPLLSPTTPTSLYIAVGSTNPIKLNSVRIAFLEILATTDQSNNVTLLISGYPAKSSVSDQPMGDKETRNGAVNRAKDAYRLVTEKGERADFVVGLEGGVVEEDDCDYDDQSNKTLYCMAWMAIYLPTASTTARKWSLSKTGSFALSSLLSTLIRNGIELGVADDIVTSRVNSKHSGGTIGVLTNGVVSRELFYKQGVLLAMCKFVNLGVVYSGVEDGEDCASDAEVKRILEVVRKEKGSG